MLKRFALFAFLVLFVPTFVNAATADLAVKPSDIRFSKTPLVSGDTIRIYTKVQNIGTLDVTGYVTFYQGSTAIDQPQVISVVAGSDPEEVFVDFLVPDGSFNIRTLISGTNPADVNLDNNVAITGMFTPIPDNDHDGVQNATDNCPSVANKDQSNIDNDSLGDVCDDDIDGDSLTNGVESELGTNPRAKDTDGDGVDDAHDAYPLDPKRSMIEKPVPVKVVVKPPAVKVDTQITSEEVFKPETNTPTQANPNTPVSNSGSTNVSSTTVPVDTELVKTTSEESARIQTSTNAVFTYEKSSWNTFAFRLIAPAQDRFAYEWNFGDGVRSSKTSVTHTYAQAGTYRVTFKTTDENGNVSEESAEVQVAFFSFSNPLILALLALLGIILLGTFTMWMKTKTKKLPEKKGPETSLKQIHVKEE